MGHSEDKRRSFRAVVAGSPERATLRFGSTEFPVVLVNQSAEGVGVLTGDPGKLQANRVGLLKTARIWYEVRVTYVLRNEPAEGEPSEQQATYRVGLQRLREIPRQNEAGVGSWRSRIVGCLLPRDSSGTFTGLALLAISVALVLAVVLFVTLVCSHLSPAAGGWLGGQPAEAATGTGGGQEPAGGGDAPPGVFRDLARRVPGADVFLLPEVADLLGLSASQQREIRRLSATTRQALEELDRRWPEDSREAREHRRAAIQEAARQEALLLVTGPQRQRWERLAQ
jgi:hypothetical protein